MAYLETSIMGSLPHERPSYDFGRAVAALIAARHPVHTAKHLAQALSLDGSDCTIRTAENILAGHLSARTITRLTRAYGMGLLIEAGAAVTGDSLASYITRQAEDARRERERWEAEEQELEGLATRARAVRSGGSGLDRPSA